MSYATVSKEKKTIIILFSDSDCIMAYEAV